jgi:hypothetical protein
VNRVYWYNLFVYLYKSREPFLAMNTERAFLRVNLLLWQLSMPRVQPLCPLPLPWESGYGIEAD